MKIHKYCILLIILGVTITHAQEDDDNDGKYRPDAIPVWEHERQDYTFSYGVKDLHTGDVKNQWEKKVGDTIQGHYTVLEPDGSLRIVHYTADEKNGFNAVVKHEGPSYHPVPTPTNPLKPTTHQHTHYTHFATPTPSKQQSSYNLKTKPTKYKFTTQHTHTQYKKPKFEDNTDTQSVNIEPEPELEAIDAYLYIPSHNPHPNQHYELISDEHHQHFVHYAQPDVPHNHKPQYDAIHKPNLKNIQIKTNQHQDPVSYDLLTPVTIDLTQIGNYDFKQQGFVEPLIETGFKPLPKNKDVKSLNPVTNIPNTFTTNKKPITTPGLKSYASDAHAQQRPHLRGPVIFPKRMDKDRIVHVSNPRTRTNGLRYTKHVAYFPDDY